MSEIKVAEWVSYEEADAKPQAPIGGCGGIMEDLTAEQYLAAWNPEAHPYIRAIFAALDATGAIDGWAHQMSHSPVFSDGTAATFSMRAWGDLVAAWWNDRNPGGPLRNYCHFAWGLPDGVDGVGRKPLSAAPPGAGS